MDKRNNGLERVFPLTICLFCLSMFHFAGVDVRETTHSLLLTFYPKSAGSFTCRNRILPTKNDFKASSIDFCRLFDESGSELHPRCNMYYQQPAT